ncbi:MAG: phage head closure protein [Comamonas sp.]|jgi:SPP1 family predicted phage head-tail adaptor|uniref:phage head closure protein n=1 Tax=Comamonas sp. TaxID=34028 RepID=UPI002829AFA9|nr:phage head closure protein [Comamonas sp.]MDR0215620.1 phage head closure protein [Comamonas sp.]
MQSGKLDEPIVLQRKGGGKDSWGTPVPGDWADAGQVWANFHSQSGSAAIKAGADVSVVRVSVRIRWREDVVEGMRLLKLSGGAVYDIEAVLPSSGRVYLDLVCKKVT